MRGLLHFCLLWLSLPCASAQSSTRFSLGRPEGYVEGATTTKAVKHVHPDRDYHWLKGRELHMTEGGYAGKLLHGPFTVYDPNGQLRESGRYRLGLKDGEWRTWNADGRLQQLQQWNDGRREGRSLAFDSAGRPMRLERYRHGVLRKVKALQSDSLKSVEQDRRAMRTDKTEPDQAADLSEPTQATGKVRSKDRSGDKRKRDKTHSDRKEKHGRARPKGSADGEDH
jgi:hypothetical protein